MSLRSALPSRWDSRSDGDCVWEGQDGASPPCAQQPSRDGFVGIVPVAWYDLVGYALCTSRPMDRGGARRYVPTLHWARRAPCESGTSGHRTVLGVFRIGFGGEPCACPNCLLRKPQIRGACIFDAPSAENRICYPTGRDCDSAVTVSARRAGGSGLRACVCDLPFLGTEDDDEVLHLLCRVGCGLPPPEFEVWDFLAGRYSSASFFDSYICSRCLEIWILGAWSQKVEVKKRPPSTRAKRKKVTPLHDKNTLTDTSFRVLALAWV